MDEGAGGNGDFCDGDEVSLFRRLFVQAFYFGPGHEKKACQW
jgi:hypothetical protein